MIAASYRGGFRLALRRGSVIHFGHTLSDGLTYLFPDLTRSAEAFRGPPLFAAASAPRRPFAPPGPNAAAGTSAAVSSRFLLSTRFRTAGQWSCNGISRSAPGRAVSVRPPSRCSPASPIVAATVPAWRCSPRALFSWRAESRPGFGFRAAANGAPGQDLRSSALQRQGCPGRAEASPQAGCPGDPEAQGQGG